MKKINAVLLILLLCLSLCGCGEKEPSSAGSDRLSFSTIDWEGNLVTFSDYSDAELIMVNYWETWCGPCVQEIPDLQALYEKYEGEGFLILGVFYDSSTDAVAEFRESAGITYPMLHWCEALAPYETQYIPTTVFFDGQGNLLTEKPYVGQFTADEWEAIITELLHE